MLATSGGTSAKFEPVKGTDTMMRNNEAKNITTKLMCVSAMRANEGKSIEELRVEDYQQNRKFPAAVSSTSTTGFSSGTTSSLFGSTAKPAFGQQTTSSLFGSTSSSASTTSTQSGGVFGFGAPKTTTASTGFGTTSVFGGGNALFGGAASQPAQTSIFGQPAAAPAQTSGFSFGPPKTTTAGAVTSFGGTSAFGAPGNTGSIFGSTAPKPLFGQPSTGFSLTNTQPMQQPQQQGFMQQPQQQGFMQQQQVNLVSDSVAAEFRQTIITNQLELYPYGDTELLRSFTARGKGDEQQQKARELESKVQADKNLFSVAKNSSPADSLKRFQQGSLSSKRPSVFNYKPLVQKIGFGAEELNDSASSSTSTSKNASKQQQNVSNNSSSFSLMKTNLFIPTVTSARKRDDPKHFDITALETSMREELNKTNGPLSTSSHSNGIEKENRPDVVNNSLVNGLARQSSSVTNTITNGSNGHSPVPRDLNFDLNHTIGSEPSRTYLELSGTGVPASDSRHSESIADESITMVTPIYGPCGLRLSKRYLYTEPALEELYHFEREGQVHLREGFCIGRLGYGKITWTGPLALSDFDLAEVVLFHRREVIVYPDENKKPPIGQGLNRPAVVCLEGVYPVDRLTREHIKDPFHPELQKFGQTLERKCLKMDCTFIDYDPENGSWVFKVRHFSRYGYFDDDEDEIDVVLPLEQQQQLQQLQRSTHSFRNRGLGFEPEYEDERQGSSRGEQEDEEERDQNMDGTIKNIRGVLEFDKSFSDTLNMMPDPKRIFFTDASPEIKPKRMRMTGDIQEFMRPLDVTHDHSDESKFEIHPLRQRTRKITNFSLSSAVFNDKALKRAVRPHQPFLFRRVGFGPSDSLQVTVLCDPEPASNYVLVNKIKLVPTVESYIEKYLESVGRSKEFQFMMETELLRMKPTSEFIREIDTYLFNSLRCNHPLETIDERMYAFCRAICQDPRDVRFHALQRNAFVEWLHSELAEPLLKRLNEVKDVKSPYVAVFYCLQFGDFKQAMKMCVKNHLIQLSMFISFYAKGRRVPEQMRDNAQKMFAQLCEGSDPYRRRIYAILAHMLSFDLKNKTINLLDGLPLLQSMAIYLQLFSTNKSSLHQIIHDLLAILPKNKR